MLDFLLDLDGDLAGLFAVLLGMVMLICRSFSLKVFVVLVFSL